MRGGHEKLFWNSVEVFCASLLRVFILIGAWFGAGVILGCPQMSECPWSHNYTVELPSSLCLRARGLAADSSEIRTGDTWQYFQVRVRCSLSPLYHHVFQHEASPHSPGWALSQSHIPVWFHCECSLTSHFCPTSPLPQSQGSNDCAPLDLLPSRMC